MAPNIYTLFIKPFLLTPEDCDKLQIPRQYRDLINYKLFSGLSQYFKDNNINDLNTVPHPFDERPLYRLADRIFNLYRIGIQTHPTMLHCIQFTQIGENITPNIKT